MRGLGGIRRGRDKRLAQDALKGGLYDYFGLIPSLTIFVLILHGAVENISCPETRA
jgi:hypothetical protein